MSAAHPVEFLLHACRTRGEKVALEAERDGHWYHYSWQSLGEQVERLARGLLLCGCTEQEKIGILAPNMPEWTLADLAILAIRGVVVPLYPTNTLEQMRYVLEDAGVRLLFVAEASQLALAQTLWQQGVISRIIVLDEQVDLAGCPVAVHLGSLLAQADAEPQLASQLDKRRAGYRLDDLLTLVYTSGTTGEPKGVMLDYANLQAVWQQHDERVSVGPEDVSLALLPLSHVYERFWSYYILYRGAKNVYLRDPQQLMSVLHLVRPTVMCAVPRVYEKAYNIIHGKVAQASLLSRTLFTWSKQVALARLAQRQTGKPASLWLRATHAVADRLVFAKMRQRFGGQARLLPVGGARLADEIYRFFNAAGLPLVYGYGMTETSATVSCPLRDTLPVGTIGTPFASLQIRLGEEGEIQVKGPTVMRGYYNKPAETAAAFTADGFLRTGDAGEFDGQGRLIFIERLKELMKTSNGKYVAPQRVEGVLAQDPLFEQVAVIADGRHYVSALIVPCQEQLIGYARSVGIEFQHSVELLRHSRIVAYVESRIQTLQQELARYEQVKKFTLLPRPFTMEQGELTPTLKLRRKVIEQRFDREIEAMYR